MKKTIFGLAALGILVSGDYVLAESENGNGNSGKSREEIVQEKKAAVQEKRCEMAQKRVANRVEFYNNRDEKHQEIYGKVIERINGFITKAKEAGIDTSKLEGYLPELESKIEKLHTDHAEFIQKVEQTEQYACGDSPEDFKNALKSAREYGKTTIKADLTAIRDYFKNTIRPELINLREQWEALNGEQEDSAE